MARKKKTWSERIAAAEARGRFTYVDQERAARWSTCACGEQDPLIARIGSGPPEDARLYQLGGEFYDAVFSNAFATARDLLRSIEIRAAQVLEEQRKDDEPPEEPS